MIIEQPCTTCGYSLETGVKLVALADIILGCATIISCSTLLAYFGDLTTETNSTTNGTDSSPNASLQGLNKNWPVNLVNDSEIGNDVATSSPVPADPTKVTDSVIKPWQSKTWAKIHREPDYTFEWVVLITVLVFSIIQVCMVGLLLHAVKEKNIPTLYIWLIIAGFSIPATGFLIKMYEMIVVFAYLEEIKGHEVSQLLEEFRKRPYYCNIQQQLYPRPNIGLGKQTKRKQKICGEYTSTVKESSLSIDEQTNRFANRQGSAAHFHNKSFLMNAPESVFSVVQFN